MTEINLDGIVEESAQKFWDARIILNGKSEWADLDPFTKMDVKNVGLPFVAYAVSPLFREFSRQINALIASGTEQGLDAGTILLSIEAELAEPVSR